MHGPANSPMFLGDIAYRVIIEKCNALESEGVDGLFVERTINVWLGPDAHAVMYPLGTTGALNIVILFSNDQIQPVAGHPDSVPDHIGQLRRFFEPWDTRLAKLLLRAPKASRWELRSCDGRGDWIYADGKFGLTGDAAHAMLPYTYVLPGSARN